MAVRSKLLYAFPAEGPPVVEDRAYRYLESTGRPSLDRELYDDELYLEAPEPEDVGPEVVAGPPDTPAPVQGLTLEDLPPELQWFFLDAAGRSLLNSGAAR